MIRGFLLFPVFVLLPGFVSNKTQITELFVTTASDVATHY